MNILVPDTPVSKREVADVSYERFNRIKHTLHFPSVNGGEVSFDVCEPKAFLDLLLQENQVTRQWYEDAWQANPSTPSTPWNLLLGWDEFTPGNKSALKNNRNDGCVVFFRGAPRPLAP